MRSTIVLRHFLLNVLRLSYDFKIARPCAVNFKIFLTDGRCNFLNTDDPMEQFFLLTKFSLLSPSLLISSSDEVYILCVVFKLVSSFCFYNILYQIYMIRFYTSLNID